MSLFLVFMKLVNFISWKQFLILEFFELLRQLYWSWEKRNEN